jgi:acetyl-CoA carboxylase biotin carboxyl carrier protein
MGGEWMDTISSDRAGTPDPYDLEQLRDALVHVLAALPRPPSRLHIRVADVGLDIRWDGSPYRPEPYPEQAEAISAAWSVGPADVRAAEPGPFSAGPLTAGPALSGPEPAPEAALVSPSVGVFYQASAPGADPFVTVGTEVEIGQQIGIVEAMKLMIPILAERAGTITGVLKADGSPVEYAEPLFSINERV